MKLVKCDNLLYYHGMLAFAEEQNQNFNKSEEIVLEGLKLGFDDPWLHHGYAHALYFQGPERNAEVLHFMESKAQSWQGGCDFIVCHLYWHWAILLLEEGNFDK